MDILLKGATVISSSSPYHQQTIDLFLQNGFITEAGTIARTADRVLEVEGLHVAPGFVDPFSHFCDPGLEYCETLESGSLAAACGGYTNVFVLPNTAPVIHNKAGVEYIQQKSRGLPVTLHPVGAITKGTEGKELAEMYDMYNSGCVAFSDGICPIQSPGILLKALQYLKAINKVVIQVPDEHTITPQGLMNEGIVSTRLGLPGKPAVAEELMIGRDLELATYTGGSLHITGVSTAKGLQLIKEAKAAGTNVTCSVTPAHLFFTDEDLATYDTNLKLAAPLRSAADRDALRQAVLDGTVDCIASHHLPQHPDNKVVEFEYAKSGMIGLETAMAVVRSAIREITTSRLVELFSAAPRRIFNLPEAAVRVDEPASLTLFLPNEEWTPERFYSKSHNSPFVGKCLTGKPLGIIHKDTLFLRP